MRLYRVFLGLAIIIVIGWFYWEARRLILRPDWGPHWAGHLDFLSDPILLCGSGVACVAALRRGIWPRLMWVGIIASLIVGSTWLLQHFNVFYSYVPSRHSAGYVIFFRILPIAQTFVIGCGAWALLSIIVRHRPRLHRFACGWRWVALLPLAAHFAWHAAVFIWSQRGQYAQRTTAQSVAFYVYSAGWAATMAPLIVLTVIGIVDRIRFHQRGRILRGQPQVRLCCPHCGARQMVPAGESRCAQCGIEFEITVTEPRCLCGYSLRDIASDRCPECGRPRAHRVTGRVIGEAKPDDA